MENLKQRLKYDDINIRSRCLQKLLNSIRQKTKGNIINSSSVQVPEMNLILEACGYDSSITSDLAVQAVITLVTNNCINVNYAINKLLNSMNSSGNYNSVIKGIISLLLYECNLLTENNKTSKYSLLYPKHPLISSIENKCDTLPFILENIIESLSTDYNKAFQALEPVICYILCNTVQKEDFKYLKILFLESFISYPKEQYKSALYITKYMPFMQIGTVNKVDEVSYFLIKLNESFSKEHDITQDIFRSIFLASFSLAERSLTIGHNPFQMLNLLVKLCASLPKIAGKSSNLLNISLILLSYMLKSASGSLLNKLAILGLNLLEYEGVSPTVASILALCVLNILPEPSLMSFSDSSNSCLSKFLSKLETIFYENKSNEGDYSDNCMQDDILQNNNVSYASETFGLIEAFTTTVEIAATCVKFCNILDKSGRTFKLKWLELIKKYVNSSTKENFEMIYSFVAALFLQSFDEELFLSTCLKTLESVLLKCPHLSTRTFSLLLYKLNVVKCPKSKLVILNFLPRSATHKYAAPPVLCVLQMMANEFELKAQAIYLMLQLWKTQDRCFPYLYSLLTETNKDFTFDSGVNEILIAQAAAILEVCNTKPEKHGHAFLSMLSTIFNKCHDETSLPVACLAIDGIIALCKSEVIDIKSTWEVLSSRLGKDKRTLVSCRMYKLLAMIPELRVKSFGYDKFMTETVGIIWKQICTSTNTPIVTSEAFKTLAKFPMDCHDLKQLPTAAKKNLQLPASMKSTPFEMSKLPEDVLSYIPGYCFIDLLMSFDDSTILEGYTIFLHSLVKMEVDELPRSVYSQTRHIAKRKKVCEALSKIPEFLCNQFQARKSPALQKNLAVGVLLCYEPPLDIGKDGLPIKRSIAAQSRTYEQVLTVLLNEVNIDINEWHRCILISNAWCSFMERAIFACEEARKAELDLQCSHGHLELNSEELNFKVKTAWLWVRDRLVGLIKTNAKSTPTAQANAIFAISGLVSALEKFYSSLNETSRTLSDETEAFISHRNFTIEYTETIICAMFPEYHSSGKVQSWLLTHLSRPNSSANYLVRGCASASLCHLASSLMNYFMDEIPRIIQIMTENILHSSPVLSFYTGKGLGLLIKSLCEAGFLNSNESQVHLILDTVNKIMKMYNDSEGMLSSCLIGLTLSISSLNQVADETIKEWISVTCNIFYERLMDEEKSSMQFEMLCICVTVMIISAVEGSCLSMEHIENLAAWIEMNRLELPQCSGISISLGMLLETYESLGLSKKSEIKLKVLKGWFNAFTSERKPTLHRIAALNGLCSLFSGGRGLMQFKVQLTAESISTLNELIPIMFQILNATRDTGLQTICSWEVGRLFSVHSNNQQVESSASSSYSYLGEKSILKPLMNVILAYQKEDETAPKYCHVISCLKSLAEPFPRHLPPINWMIVLTPFLQQDKDIQVIEIAIKVIIYQSSGSSYASNLLVSYCCPPLIHTLPESCFKILLENIPALGLILPPGKFHSFLQIVILQTIKKVDKLETLGYITMKGILNSLKETACKDQSKKVLQDAFVLIFKYFKTDEIYLKKFLQWISEALLLLPTDIFDSLMSVSQNVEEIAELTMIWCYLVKNGNKPLKSLKLLVEEGKHSTSEQKEKLCFYIYDCFLYGNQNDKSEIMQVDKCISWLLETIGWIKTLQDSTSKYQLLASEEAYIFLTDVCLATIIGCAGLENSYFILPYQCLDHCFLLKSFSQAINLLSQNSDWNAVIDKIIDWLMMMLKSQYLKENEKYYIKLSLCSLRNTSQFQKAEIWTEVICNINKIE